MFLRCFDGARNAASCVAAHLRARVLVCCCSLSQSRKNIIESVSASRIQARARGIIARRRFRQAVQDSVLLAKRTRAQTRISRSFRAYLAKKGVDQELLECVVADLVIRSPSICSCLPLSLRWSHADDCSAFASSSGSWKHGLGGRSFFSASCAKPARIATRSASACAIVAADIR
jgi:hypothetical protein